MTLAEIVLDDYDPGRSWLGRKWHGWARVDEMPLDELSETHGTTFRFYESRVYETDVMNSPQGLKSSDRNSSLLEPPNLMKTISKNPLADGHTPFLHIMSH